MSVLMNLFENEKYLKLSDLNSQKTVSLVRENATGRLLVRRTVDASYEGLYRNLRKHSFAHIPAICQITEAEVGDPDEKPPESVSSLKSSSTSGKDSLRTLYIYEEYIEGRTLDQVLREKGRLDEEIAVGLMNQLCEVLEDIHSLRIVHRDIKPQNLMIRSDGMLYLIDFDISRIFKAEKTADTVLMGTQGYASPEQYGFRESDHRSDIYSACVLFNVMLTGTFPSKSMEQSRRPHEAFWKVIQKGISLEPSQRYDTVHELNEAVQEAGHRVIGDVVWTRMKKRKKGRMNPSGFSWSYVPGFRTRTRWKMITMSMFYLIMLFLAIGLCELCFMGDQLGMTACLIMLLFMIQLAGLYILFFNVFNIHSCFRLTKGAQSGLSYLVRSGALAAQWWIGSLFFIVMAVILFQDFL